MSVGTWFKGSVVVLAVGLVVVLPMRLSDAYLALATFSVAIVVPALIRKFSHFTGGTVGLFLPISTGHRLYIQAWIVAGIMLLLAWLILRARLGRAFRAIRDSEVAAT